MLPFNVSVKRKKDFAETGEYIVTIDGKCFTIYKDPETRWWYEVEPWHVRKKQLNPYAGSIGDTKMEAIQTLLKRVRE